MIGNLFKKLLQPLHHLRGVCDANKVGVKSDRYREPSPLVPVRGQNLPPPWPRARIVLSAPMVAPLMTGSSEEQDEEDSDDELPAMPSSKGRHLWCLGDSYGYTKGSKNCFAILKS